MTIKPSGTTPRDHYWDPWMATYRRKETHALYVPAAERRAQHRTSHANVQQAQRLRGYNRARCNDDILKPGFDLASVKPHDGGSLGDVKCAYCGALLYPSEAVPIPTRGGLKRGKYCCAEGQVELPPVEEHAAVDALWRGTDEQSKTLRKHSRQFNNALALASELYEEVDIEGWAPSLVLAGKLYHSIGPLEAQGDNQPGFAQLYVHDPAAENDEAIRRYSHRYMDGKASKPEKARALALLTELQRTMRECNSYVQDFVTAGEIFADGDVDDAHFVIEPKARPAAANKRTYKDTRKAFNEVTVMAVEPRGGKVPKRSVMIRARAGGLYDIDETNRAFDPLHFVLLFPCGDDGWTTGLHKCPKAVRRARRDGDTWDAQSGVWVPRAPGARAARENSPENETVNPREDNSDSNPEDDPDALEPMHDGAQDEAIQPVDGSESESDVDMEDAPPTARTKAKKKKEQQVSVRQYYAYRLHQRAPTADPEPLFRATRLFQEYCCMSYAKQEMQRLRYYDTHQDTIRADLYQNLHDAVTAHDHASGAPVQAGTRVILPATFTGGPRNMHRRYQDAMAVVRKHGRPSFFITMTCNPKWKEITDALGPGQEPHDRPDLITRVFKFKLDALLDELYNESILGRTVAHLHVIEFQHRGLPHAHILVILKPEDRLKSAEEIDAIVSAELPVKPQQSDFADDDEYAAALQTYETLTELVCANMVHRQCGKENPHAECCRETGKCEKHFPKELNKITTWSEHEIYPQYRRRARADGGVEMVHDFTTRNADGTFTQRSRVLNNGWVVPHNRYLLLKYQCHINVEVCISVESVKYLYKYVYKGSDKAAVKVKRKRRRGSRVRAPPNETREEQRERHKKNEIDFFQETRVFGSCEACWRTFDFPLYNRTPPVKSLPVHLENQQYTAWKEGTEVRADARGAPKTELTRWLDYIRNPPPNDLECRALKYTDFPAGHTYTKKGGWAKYKKRPSEKDTPVGRMHTVHPSAGEPFYLRTLLNHVVGSDLEPRRPADGDGYNYRTLLNVPDRDAPAETFREACELRGLLRDDKEWHETMAAGAAIITKAASLRELFVSIIVHNDLERPAALFDEFCDAMGDDFVYARTRRQPGVVVAPDVVRALVLLDIEARLLGLGNKPAKFGLELDDAMRRTAQEAARETTGSASNKPRVIADELRFDKDAEAADAAWRRDEYTEAQGELVAAIVAAIKAGKPLAAFVDALGGAGKTFCFNGMLAHVRGNGDIALAVASSGIAGLLLKLGRTFHSRFKANLKPQEGEYLKISAGTALAKLLQDAKLIVWDEAPMMHRFHLEALDRTLKDLMRPVDAQAARKPFGGKVVVLGGDFRQTLPIVKRGSRAQTVAAAMHQSDECWKHFRQYRLHENIRVRHATGDRAVLQSFADWLLRIGDGTEPIVDGTDDSIALDPDLCMKPTADGKVDLEGLVEWVFPNLAARCADADDASDWLAERALLAPLNSSVDELNQLLLERFPGRATTCLSADTIIKDTDGDASAKIPVEYLNSQRTTGLPEHALQIKPNMPLMLLRNLNPREGLCNGTRLLARGLHANNKLLEAQIISGAREHRGRIVLLPRIDLYPEPGVFNFDWCRRQFPVRAAFAMTINKAQGQTLHRVGVYLHTPCFAHGQLYVAASRVGHPDHIRFALLPDAETGEYVTRNVVFREALTYDADDGASDASSNPEDDPDLERDAAAASPDEMSDGEPDGEWLDANEARSEDEEGGYESDFVDDDGAESEGCPEDWDDVVKSLGSGRKRARLG